MDRYRKSITRRRDAAGSAPTDSYSYARDAEDYCGSFCARPKERSPALGPGPLILAGGHFSSKSMIFVVALRLFRLAAGMDIEIFG